MIDREGKSIPTIVNPQQNLLADEIYRPAHLAHAWMSVQAIQTHLATGTNVIRVIELDKNPEGCANRRLFSCNCKPLRTHTAVLPYAGEKEHVNAFVRQQWLPQTMLSYLSTALPMKGFDFRGMFEAGSNGMIFLTNLMRETNDIAVRSLRGIAGTFTVNPAWVALAVSSLPPESIRTFNQFEGKITFCYENTDLFEFTFDIQPTLGLRNNPTMILSYTGYDPADAGFLCGVKSLPTYVDGQWQMDLGFYWNNPTDYFTYLVQPRN